MAYLEEKKDPNDPEKPKICDLCRNEFEEWDMIIEVVERTIHKNSIAYYDHHKRIKLYHKNCWEKTELARM